MQPLISRFREAVAAPFERHRRVATALEVHMRRLLVVFTVLSLSAIAAARRQTAPADRAAAPATLENPFAAGWMLTDTNTDGIPDAVRGRIVVPDDSSAAEDAAAADLAARVAYGSTGLTLPLVVTSGDASGTAGQPHVWIGERAVPAAVADGLKPLAATLAVGEGGVFEAGSDIAVIGKDEAGLLAAAEAYASHAPYQWKVPGDELIEIPRAVDAALAAHALDAKATLAGLVYTKDDSGIHRALLRLDGARSVSRASLLSSLHGVHLDAVGAIVVLPPAGSPVVIENRNRPAAARPAAAPAAAAPGGGERHRLDLATLFTIKGLFGGSPKMPVPASLDGHLYVPAGAAGVAMANLAARLGLETTGITIPLASPAAGAAADKISTQGVMAGDSPLTQAVEKTLGTQVPDWAKNSTLQPGEGIVRVVDDALGEQAKNKDAPTLKDALLVKGDARGTAAALDLLADHFPNLWDVGKQHLSLEEIRHDLHRFFSLRSGVGQAAAALYHLDRWMNEIAPRGGAAPQVGNVEADIYVDTAYPGLDRFVEQQIEQRLHVNRAAVRTGSLHAGMQCCADNPPLHYQGPGYPFQQAAPTFEEDIAIPWEGNRLLKSVQDAVAKRLKRDVPVTLEARVSEGPQERQKLATEIEAILAKAGAAPQQTTVHVLSAYKQGYSWLMDEIAPALHGQPVARLQIQFAPNIDEKQMSSINSRMRWVQELYPVDEMLAKTLNIPLDKIEISEMPPAGKGETDPTYVVHAYAADGREILTRDFNETVAEAPYSHAYPRYDYVQVETGWVKLTAGSQVVLDQRIETDPEVFWNEYQTKTLPRVFESVMSQAHGRPRAEYQPFFDTLRLDIHMSEPDYALGLDKERISMLEAMQEDTFYSTENFFYMIGYMEMGEHWDYPGRIIPIVHASEDGQDGHVHVEFYGKPAANPVVRLRWTDAAGRRHEQERDLPALRAQLTPRLVEARVTAGRPGVDALTWSLPVDFDRDRYREWLRVAARDNVEQTIVSAEQAQGQVHWLEQMHQAGLYRDSIAYPNLQAIGMEFVLPPDRRDPIKSVPGRIAARLAVPKPATPRPQIADFLKPQPAGQPIVQWDQPISPDENAGILARLATHPEVTPYWMGRSYLGINIWAADVMLPTPSRLRSWAKETTLKAAAIYSGRQHANEVSSTSHIDKLGELLVSDPATHDALRQVNVVLHPITNPDGAQLSVDLYHITPDNLLHPGYHGSLTADVSSGQWEADPLYPESRTRRQLWEAWLPDTFLNPHGYPSHEWVQPFSGYTGWVISRMGAHNGREWWLPRGWFTSLNYLRDPAYPYSEQFTYDLRNRIADAIGKVPDLMPLETRMNARYQRWGQRWDPDHMMQPIVGGVRIYMALKGAPPAPTQSAFMRRFPDVTYDDGYTEAPDETAYGPYMKLMASAGLAFDKVHLDYLSQGKLRIHRDEKAVGNGVQWSVARERPILPSSQPPVPEPK
ncbi:MAG: M14 family zinc carboxypeptidase [Betaproteobacteria bacterium]